MIGRTAPSNPWIFRQIRQYADTGHLRASRGDADRYQMIRTYFQMLVDEDMPGTPGKMKQFVAWFTHGVPGGSALRQAVYHAKEGPAILASVDRFFEELLGGKASSITPEEAESAEDGALCSRVPSTTQSRARENTSYQLNLGRNQTAQEGGTCSVLFACFFWRYE